MRIIKQTFKFGDNSTAVLEDCIVWMSFKPTHILIGGEWRKYKGYDSWE